MYRCVVSSLAALASSAFTSMRMAQAEPVAGAKAKGREAATLCDASIWRTPLPVPRRLRVQLG
eukprot:102939-Pleurochrysis_carterae.AAC.1